ncbi:hypothetical protein GKODMF_06730 [Candidatus Electrothrix gigas]
MFTGIIQGLGTVTEKHPAGGGMVFCLEAGFDLTDPEEGESIAVNGACLTARDIKGRRFLVDVSPESLTRTSLGQLEVGSKVNMERALRLADRLGGHLVSGHVDTMGRVEERKAAGDFTLFTFSLNASLSKYIIEKGSITIDRGQSDCQLLLWQSLFCINYSSYFGGHYSWYVTPRQSGQSGSGYYW